MSETQTPAVLAPEAIELFNAMASAIKGKDKKKKDKKAKFVMVVNGKVMPQLIPGKKEAKAAARSIVLSMLAKGCKEPVIAIAEINTLLTVDVPVADVETKGIKG